MATQHGSGAQSPPGPSHNQASTTQSAKISSARCRVFREEKLSDKNLSNGQWQPKYTPARKHVAFKYSAGSTEASVSTSATNTARETAQAERVHGRNAALCLHFLKRKIKLTISKIDSASRDIESGIGLLNSKVSSYAQHLDNKIQELNASKDAHAVVVKEFERLKGEQDSYAQDLDTKIKLLKKSHDEVVSKLEYMNLRREDFDYNSANMRRILNSCETLTGRDLDRKNKIHTFESSPRYLDRQIQRLTTTKEAYARDLDKLVNLQNARALSNADDLDKQMKLLSARKFALVRVLVKQVNLTNARSDSHGDDLQRRTDLFNQQITSYQHEINKQSQLVNSQKAPFVQDLDGQLQLLDSKLAAFYHDLEKQCALLNSNVNSYFTDVNEKKELLNRSLASYFGTCC